MGFFFVKQKTAYELTRWLEFRRVLFRSNGGRKPLVGAAHDHGSRLPRRPHPPRHPRAQLLRERRVARAGHEGRRSEERRVGKEWRSRSADEPIERTETTRKT